MGLAGERRDVTTQMTAPLRRRLAAGYDVKEGDFNSLVKIGIDGGAATRYARASCY
ncbi:hypothetical protein NOV72_01649 [Caballeronia novacaledonica]|uniref:Uncharacterized protein n=1 Tax=Caballeronia novacaledonica TaxID=1544861 RepID=A0A2U3I2S3_9BURK|nr:hypothetical protein NOV72_01649 [Caballeronia novacaledonica]